MHKKNNEKKANPAITQRSEHVLGVWLGMASSEELGDTLDVDVVGLVDLDFK